jgi:hypothetical protein
VPKIKPNLITPAAAAPKAGAKPAPTKGPLKPIAAVEAVEKEKAPEEKGKVETCPGLNVF